MLNLEKIPGGYKTLPGTEYAALAAFIADLRDRGIAITVLDDEGTMYLTFA